MFAAGLPGRGVGGTLSRLIFAADAYLGNVMLAAPDAATVGIFLDADPRLQTVCDRLRRLAGEDGTAVYLVGGPVRDYLLGAAVNDLDIAVAGDAIGLAERLAEDVGGRLRVHRRFGTATVSAAGAVVDLVTARRERYRRPGALPDVRPGSIGEDLARRDFTVNAMAIPLSGDAVDLVDPHGGRDDLRAGVIRILHRQSFRDDPTRILRAIRYAARFGFRIAEATLDELQDALAGGAMSSISGDRARHELARMLGESRPLPGLAYAEELGALRAIHPALSAGHLSGTGLGAEGLGPLTWLAALVWNTSPDEGRAFAARINAPAEWARVIGDTGRLAERLPELAGPEVSPSEICGLLDGIESDALAAARLLGGATASERIGRYAGEWRQIAPCLGGEDLLALGVPAGPSVGEALRALRRARLDGAANSRRDEETLARQWAGPAPGRNQRFHNATIPC